ncbi:signal transduction histidine kinase [Bacillus sp. SORGH_AS 510]|uniref:ATP-binding protein n=1 Tax=Bacillus sp. SORGH_AS_0510 TaxID=3041771 RepID=UPI002787ABBA|nr:ATP-binding protein [Bacillus sp. SORGH_AS_0510]MDQ1147490.1 signal transduction histidine kinase [Bacillus sp. SORGH_AS_0510]
MNQNIKSPQLILEEKKALRLFLWLFYIVYFSFDIFTYYILPNSLKSNKVGTPEEGLGYWIYIFLIAILPIAIWIMKKGNLYLVKYIYIYCYIGIDFINSLLIYIGSPKPYASGHIVEVLFILFCPIFINKRFFWTVSLGMIGKYLLIGVILQDLQVIIPSVIYIMLTGIAYVILARFYSYIGSLTSVHEELRNKERLAVIGQMATTIGHEIRNPLSSLKGFTQLQQEQYPNTNDYYPIMIQEIDRINSIVNDLMYIGKPRTIHFEKASIEEITAYIISITQPEAERQGITIETIIEGSLPLIDCDSKQLKQVFLNLIKNAIESMPGGGCITIEVKVVEKHNIHICIQDEGLGIKDENILNLCEPFFTTKENGTGLGLVVTNQIIKEHSGELNIQSEIKKGTKVTVVLPIHQRKPI